MILFLHQEYAVFQSQFCDVVVYAMIQGHHTSKGPQILSYYSEKNYNQHSELLEEQEKESSIYFHY